MRSLSQIGYMHFKCRIGSVAWPTRLGLFRSSSTYRPSSARQLTCTFRHTAPTIGRPRNRENHHRAISDQDGRADQAHNP